VKVPYSNAGQGVYTITNEAELEAMMAEPEMYVQHTASHSVTYSITQHHI
jgi:hypothetical protein